MAGENVRFGVLCCVLSVPIECRSAVSGRKPFEEREQARNTKHGAHDVVNVGSVNNHVSPVAAILSREVSLALLVDRVRLTWLLHQSQIPRIAKRHFTHYVEGQIVEILDNVHSLSPILVLDTTNYS